MDPRQASERIRRLISYASAGRPDRNQMILGLRGTLNRLAGKDMRLPSSLRQKANAAMERAGLDGNRPMRSFSQGISVAGDVLGRFGIIVDDIVTAPHSPDGRQTYTVAFKAAEGSDPFDPGTPISNSMLAVTWHKHETTGNYEVIAYLS